MKTTAIPTTALEQEFDHLATTRGNARDKAKHLVRSGKIGWGEQVGQRPDGFLVVNPRRSRLVHEEYGVGLLVALHELDAAGLLVHGDVVRLRGGR